MGQPTIAINVPDLDRNRLAAQIMLAGALTDRTTRVDDDRFDEWGVILTGDIVRLGCMADVLRRKDRANRVHPTRVYLSRTGERGWQSFGHQGDLCEVIDGKVRLTRKAAEMLGVETSAAEPIAAERMDVGSTVPEIR